ncbi:MAG: hypothetical protein H0V63_01730 [Burkholderiaceae bacterium]|nr:hypothetical protein [Burkholderiaceae bacterium]
MLFVLLGLFFLIAAFQTRLLTLAFVAAILSVGSFLWLAWSVGGYNAQVGRVFTVDIVALVCLAIGIAAHIRISRSL